MTCDLVQLPGGASAIVCSSRKRQRCACGEPATLLCDWKVAERKSGTCDKPICAGCAEHVAADKDLCPAHTAAFARWRAEKAGLQQDSSNIAATSPQGEA